MAAEPIGFGAGGGTLDLGPVESVLLEVFRREFLNRLDRVVVFRPLGAGVMREILVKELESVLARRGFRNRQWAVEWDGSALEFFSNKVSRQLTGHVLSSVRSTVTCSRRWRGPSSIIRCLTGINSVSSVAMESDLRLSLSIPTRTTPSYPISKS